MLPTRSSARASNHSDESLDEVDYAENTDMWSDRRGPLEWDPRSDDPFHAMTEQRARVKATQDMDARVRDHYAQGLKITSALAVGAAWRWSGEQLVARRRRAARRY